MRGGVRSPQRRLVGESRTFCGTCSPLFQAVLNVVGFALAIVTAVLLPYASALVDLVGPGALFYFVKKPTAPQAHKPRSVDSSLHLLESAQQLSVCWGD